MPKPLTRLMQIALAKVPVEWKPIPYTVMPRTAEALKRRGLIEIEFRNIPGHRMYDKARTDCWRLPSKPTDERNQPIADQSTTAGDPGRDLPPGPQDIEGGNTA